MKSSSFAKAAKVFHCEQFPLYGKLKSPMFVTSGENGYRITERTDHNYTVENISCVQFSWVKVHTKFY